MPSRSKQFTMGLRCPLLTYVILLFLLAALVFIGFYLAHDHLYLAAWFRQLHPCFYRNVYWERDFFTAATKARGNIFCLAGIAGIGGIAWLVLRTNADPKAAPKISVTLLPADYLCFIALAAISIALWRFANQHILPYNDEVFSAIHCVELHPLQTVSYYMLPNNHILYNLLNNLLFHFAGDHLYTGRLISGACFYLLLVLLYLWFRQLMGTRLVALILTLAVGVHFQVWGFGAMNRGYELYLLCEWGGFIFLFQYFRQPSSFWLKWLAVCIIAGFTTLPTFLYFALALILLILLRMCYRRTFDRLLLRYAILTGLLVFLCYLPALCFSGAGAFVADEHIKGADAGYGAFFGMLLQELRKLLEYSFTGYFTVDEDVYLILAAIPLLSLIWFRKPDRFLPGLFFLLLWLTTFLFSWGMKQYPFARNLIGHFSFTYALILLTACWGVQDLLQLLRLRRMLVAGVLLLTTPFFYHYIKLSRERMAMALYHFDINTYARLLALDLRDLPPHAEVGFSDESFYLLYLSRQRGFRTASCTSGQEEYYIRIDGELLPTPPVGHYELMWERGDFRIYQRKP